MIFVSFGRKGDRPTSLTSRNECGVKRMSR
jgi:hypothetical protein